MTFPNQGLMRAMILCLVLLATFMMGFSNPLYAADEPQMASKGTFLEGKSEYMEHCASCHGSRGKGDGAVAQFLTLETADLTLLSKANLGVFPREKVYSVIDGRVELLVHGPRTMPVWGNVFREMERGESTANSQSQNRDYSRMIEDLVSYIETLQD